MPEPAPTMIKNLSIELDNVSKRFNREWIFRHCSYRFEQGKYYAITGSNGSGKSTLLQVVSGSLTHNEGKITITAEGNPVAEDQLYNHVAIAAPYLELVEEMTASEMLHFHAQFKTFLPGLTIGEMLKTVSLEKAAHKQIRYFSSGMKQRLKLAQAFFSNTAVLLLDEPTTNLDADGVALYHRLINQFIQNRLVIVSSNDKQEYDFCESVIKIGDYK